MMKLSLIALTVLSLIGTAAQAKYVYAGFITLESNDKELTLGISSMIAEQVFDSMTDVTIVNEGTEAQPKEVRHGEGISCTKFREDGVRKSQCVFKIDRNGNLQKLEAKPWVSFPEINAETLRMGCWDAKEGGGGRFYVKKKEAHALSDFLGYKMEQNKEGYEVRGSVYCEVKRYTVVRRSGPAFYKPFQQHCGVVFNARGAGIPRY